MTGRNLPAGSNGRALASTFVGLANAASKVSRSWPGAPGSVCQALSSHTHTWLADPSLNVAICIQFPPSLLYDRMAPVKGALQVLSDETLELVSVPTLERRVHLFVLAVCSGASVG